MRTALPHLVLSSLLLAACGEGAPRTGDAEAADAKTPGDARAGDAKAADAEAKAGDIEPSGDARTPRDAKAGPAADAPAGKARTWSFDEALPGEVPAGIRPTEAGGTGTPATWAVVADPAAPSPPHAFGITESRNTKKTYNLALVEGTRFGDVDLQVMVKAGTGALNQGGGLVWRVKDTESYYIARWDPLEDNVYLYIVQGGVRTALAKLDLELDTESWHALRVVAEGPRIELFIDDRPVLTAHNAELTEPGMIGLWTKSDAATLFDDLSVAAP